MWSHGCTKYQSRPWYRVRTVMNTPSTGDDERAEPARLSVYAIATNLMQLVQRHVGARITQRGAKALVAKVGSGIMPKCVGIDADGGHTTNGPATAVTTAGV
ncbi:hypothetical protein GGF32_006336 [Allomyces javanicus]|nr:hypothetical protein GGF32_006336 [Allomyces javanicus]